MTKIVFSERAINTTPPFTLAYAITRDVDPQALRDKLTPLRSEREQLIRRATNGIQENIRSYDDFFKSSGFHCPLLNQLQRVLTRGFPASNPLVDLLLMAELSVGVLMGVHDLKKINGDLTFDLSEARISFDGIAGNVTCRPNEPILRDSIGTIASYFQGPDRRTKITSNSIDLLWIAFSAPNVSIQSLLDALGLPLRLLGDSAEATPIEILSINGTSQP